MLAVDGEVGRIETVYFNTVTWVICYLCVDAVSWLPGRQVLISPVAVGEIKEKERTIYIELTRKQIAGSPPLSAGSTITRQYELEYYQYYQWIPYWELSSLLGVSRSKDALTQPSSKGTNAIKAASLACATQLKGYVLAALDGEVGIVDDFIVDTQYWLIRYLQVDTSNWQRGHVLIYTGWIKTLCWPERSVSVVLTRDVIKRAPGFEPSMRISRADEAQLFKHYGHPVYWRKENGSD